MKKFSTVILMGIALVSLETEAVKLGAEAEFAGAALAAAKALNKARQNPEAVKGALQALKSGDLQGAMQSASVLAGPKVATALNAASALQGGAGGGLQGLAGALTTPGAAAAAPAITGALATNPLVTNALANPAVAALASNPALATAVANPAAALQTPAITTTGLQQAQAALPAQTLTPTVAPTTVGTAPAATAATVNAQASQIAQLQQALANNQALQQATALQAGTTAAAANPAATLAQPTTAVTPAGLVTLPAVAAQTYVDPATQALLDQQVAVDQAAQTQALVDAAQTEAANQALINQMNTQAALQPATAGLY